MHTPAAHCDDVYAGYGLMYTVGSLCINILSDFGVGYPRFTAKYHEHWCNSQCIMGDLEYALVAG